MKLTRILIGMDFSAPAVAAARWVADQLAPDAELILAHVVDPPAALPFHTDAVPPRKEVIATATEFAEHRLKEIATYVAPGAGRRMVRVGPPHVVLPIVADEVKADLIVVGPHGDRPRPWKLLGTTADRLVRASHVPVLVATSPPAAPPREILAAVDDADITRDVLCWTREIAMTFGSQVTLMHVLSNAVYSHVTSMAHAHHVNSDDEADREIRRELEGEGVRWIEKLAREGCDVDMATAAVTFGTPSDALLAMAETVSCDLMVLGRHGSGEVAPALLGSTLAAVLHGARCPVLVVTGPPRP